MRQMIQILFGAIGLIGFGIMFVMTETGKRVPLELSFLILVCIGFVTVWGFINIGELRMVRKERAALKLFLSQTAVDETLTRLAENMRSCAVDVEFWQDEARDAASEGERVESQEREVTARSYFYDWREKFNIACRIAKRHHLNAVADPGHYTKTSSSSAA